MMARAAIRSGVRHRLPGVERHFRDAARQLMVLRNLTTGEFACRFAASSDVFKHAMAARPAYLCQSAHGA